MAKPLVDPVEQAPPIPSSPISAFLWAGLFFLLAAAGVGVWASVWASQNGGAPPYLGFFLAVCFLVSGGALLFAQARYLFWRLAAGVTEVHPLTPEAVRLAHAEEDGDSDYNSILLFGLFLAALLLRLPALFQSLSHDELWTLSFMRSGPLAALTTQLGFNNHPLHSLLGSACVKAYASTGVDVTKEVLPAWLVRLPAFVFGVLSPPMLYKAGRNTLGKPAALLAGLLLALSPAAIDYSCQSRGYSLLVFFSIAQSYWLQRALRRSAARAWVWWLLCATLGVFSHLYFVFVLLVDGIYMLCNAAWSATWMRNRSRGVALVEQTILLSVAWAALALACYAGILVDLGASLRDSAGSPPLATAREVIAPLLQLWGGIPQPGLVTSFYAMAGLLSALGIWHLITRGSGAAVYLPLLLVVPLLIVEAVKPHFVYARFFAFALPAFLALVGAGIWELAILVVGQKEHRASGRAGMAVLLVLGFVALTSTGLQQVLRVPRQDYARAAERARQEQGKSKVILGLGNGAELFPLYGVRLEVVKNEAQVRKRLEEQKQLFLLDTEMIVDPKQQKNALFALLRKSAGKPLAIFPGRFSGWPYAWQDGDSDIKLYALRAGQLPPLPPGQARPPNEEEE